MPMSFFKATFKTLSPVFASKTAPSGHNSSWGKNIILGILSFLYLQANA
jgi:hypothetical protein